MVALPATSPHASPTCTLSRRVPAHLASVDGPIGDLCTALERAALTGRGVVLVGSDETESRRTYAEIWEGARRRAAALRARGLGEGEAVVMVLPTSFEFVETFFGVLLAGGVPVPAYPPVAMARLQSYVELLAHITGATSAKLLVTDRKIGQAIGEVGRVPGLAAIVDIRRLDAEPEADVHRPAPGDAGLIQCTSGSTSAPKPVLLLQRNLLANIAALRERLEVREDDVFASWLPLYHDLGLIGQMLSAVVGGNELVLLAPSVFLLDPGAWWRAISRHRANISAAPCFAFGLSEKRLGGGELDDLDLSSLRVLASGAEPVQPEVIRGFMEAFADTGLRQDAFCAAYGLAESCVGVSGARPGDGLTVDRVDREALEDPSAPRAVPATGERTAAFVSVGPALPGQTLAIRDERGRDLPERRVGEVWVRGESVMAGYLDHPEATGEVVRAGWLRTGDLGYVADGELYIVGRIKHMLIVRGRNYYAESIEAVVEGVRGVRKGNAVAFGVYDERRGCDRLWVAVETRLGGEDERDELQRAIAAAVNEEVGIAPQQVVLLSPNTIPKTSSGKKQRQRTRERILSGDVSTRRRRRDELAGVATMVKSQIARAERAVQRMARRAV